ncbi:MAG TPA: transglycosylase SLT domain-containing protein [Pyrinomonadaceae bacterium]|nr:transglycosylase SLT domain-containing protein [Pyrinomonadaceae bacterium]
MKLTVYHAYENSVRWRLTPRGVEIEGSGVERTKGAPATVTRVWEKYSDEINRVARTRRVPCALIIACICTESNGKADAIRFEPGYKSDEETPHRVSPGLMQTLISSASEALGRKVDRQWLFVPGNAIDAGAAFIARQFKQTGFDPPLVGAAYNAGSLRHQDGSQNRWKLRQYPIGTGKHCDRFVQFFNDAVYVLANHSTSPAVGIDALLGEEGAARPSSSQNVGGRTTPASSSSSSSSSSGKGNGGASIEFGKNARRDDFTPHSQKVLEDILRQANLSGALISSTSRTPADQARVMFNNLEREGVEKQKRLYGPYGDKVIDVYVRSKNAGRTDEQIKLDMEAKIKDLGPTNVSKHTADPRVYNVFDIAPSSIRDRRAFEQAVNADERVKKFLTPSDSDPAYHLEIPQPRGQG